MPDLILFTLLSFIQPQRLPLQTLRHQMTQPGPRLVDQFTLSSVKSTDGSLRVQSALKFEMHRWLNTELINRYRTKQGLIQICSLLQSVSVRNAMGCHITYLSTTH